MFAEVIIDCSNSEIDKVYDYSIPKSLNVTRGMRVIVPFGKQITNGFVLKVKEKSNYEPTKIKSIIKSIDEKPIIMPELINLIDFMKEQYHLRIVDILRLYLPSEMRTGKVKDKTEVLISLSDCYKDLLEKQRKNAKNIFLAVEYLEKKSQEKKSTLSNMFSNATINALINKGIVTATTTKHRREVNNDFTIQNKVTQHTQLQQIAIKKIEDNKKPILLFGVTGSGKTEVYMTSIEKVIAKGKTAIMLVPEISLTPQIFALFKRRFGDNVAILHSGLTAGQRYDEWSRLLNGEAKIAIGARSAIFAPLSNIGIIIIDEEHDTSYFSESNPRYNTKEIAEFRANANNCVLVLGSATPDIETFYKAKTGVYDLLELPVRINGKSLPNVTIVDMLSEIRNGNTGIFSNALLSALQECITNNKQAMLFINRRGYTSFMRCNECGYVAKCANCDVSLVYHKTEDKLKCHYCGKSYKALTVCPNCNSKSIRQGAVGTQKVVETLLSYFKNVKIFRMDNDSTQNKDSHVRILSEFSKTKPAILVGTQMIAKGHDFNDVTVVGIIDADQSLYHSDYRSVERTFSLITQVSGRAGRNESEGKVYLQTYAPRHYIYRFVSSYNYLKFYEKEINLREVSSFPPFSEIVRVLFCGNNEEIVKSVTKMCYNKFAQLSADKKEDFIYIDALKAPIGKIKNMFRYEVLMRYKIKNAKDIRSSIYAICDEIVENKVSVFVEINPQNIS